MDEKTKEKVVSARSYAEFAEKVREEVEKNPSFQALAFLKAVGGVAVFTDREGNKTYFRWERRRV